MQRFRPKKIHFDTQQVIPSPKKYFSGCFFISGRNKMLPADKKMLPSLLGSLSDREGSVSKKGTSRSLIWVSIFFAERAAYRVICISGGHPLAINGLDAR